VCKYHGAAVAWMGRDGDGEECKFKNVRGEDVDAFGIRIAVYNRCVDAFVCVCCMFVCVEAFGIRVAMYNRCVDVC